MLEDREIEELLGRSLNGCRLVRLIARGRTGIVAEAVREADSLGVDVKVLHPYLTEVTGFAERFVHEARAAVARRHPNLQRVYSAGAAGRLHFLALEHLTGRNLRDWLAADRPDGLAARSAALAWIVPQAGAALGALHREGVSHGDVKPSNILLTESGRVVLLDARLASILYADDVPILIGAPEYMAPEQAAAEQPGDQAGDQYALAVIAYELLVGRVPFAGPTPGATLRLHQSQPPPPPAAVLPALPAGVEAALLRALAKAPAERYPSIDDFVGALLLALAPVAAPAPWRAGPTAPAAAALPPSVAAPAVAAASPAAPAPAPAAPSLPGAAPAAVPAPPASAAERDGAPPDSPPAPPARPAAAPRRRQPARGSAFNTIAAVISTLLVIAVTLAALYFILGGGRGRPLSAPPPAPPVAGAPTAGVPAASLALPSPAAAPNEWCGGRSGSSRSSPCLLL
jgi:hypothetical protein